MGFNSGFKGLKCSFELGGSHLPVAAPFFQPCWSLFKIQGCKCHLHLSAMQLVTLCYDKTSQVAGLHPDWHRLIFCIQPQSVASLDFYRVPSLEQECCKIATTHEVGSGGNSRSDPTLHSLLTLRRLMSYIYMEHPFLMFLDHTQRRSTVGRTPLDE